MELIVEHSQESRIGAEAFVLSTGQSLRIETSPDGEEILDFEADKVYTVTVNVHMVEGA